jgi:hypothetical protein
MTLKLETTPNAFRRKITQNKASLTNHSPITLLCTEEGDFEYFTKTYVDIKDKFKGDNELYELGWKPLYADIHIAGMFSVYRREV